MEGDSKFSAKQFTLRTGVRLTVCVLVMSMVMYFSLYMWSIRNTSTQFRQRLQVSAIAQKPTNHSELSNTRLKLGSFTADMNTPKSLTNRYGEDVRLLTIFTTWPPNDSKYKVRNATLRNWASFKPLIRPVFFSCNGTNTKDVIKYDWDLLPVSRTDASGVPVLKYMYLEVISKYKSLFYAFANGDILFDNGLISTLLAVANASVRQDKPIFIIGRRTNVNNVTDDESGSVENITKVAKKKGQYFMTVAEDYFITDSSYPWADIPGLVIGRTAYDNWLVLHSCEQRFTVIDATMTLLALHQTTEVGNFEGSTRKNSNFNAQLLSKSFKNIQYNAGSTSCAPWVTRWINHNTHKQIELSRRANLSKMCFQY